MRRSKKDIGVNLSYPVDDSGVIERFSFSGFFALVGANVMLLSRILETHKDTDKLGQSASRNTLMVAGRNDGMEYPLAFADPLSHKIICLFGGDLNVQFKLSGPRRFSFLKLLISATKHRFLKICRVPMNGKTVDMRLTIFPATSHKTIHGFITIQVADLLRCSEPRWRLHSTPPPSLEAGLKRRPTTPV